MSQLVTRRSRPGDAPLAQAAALLPTSSAWGRRERTGGASVDRSGSHGVRLRHTRGPRTVSARLPPWWAPKPPRPAAALHRRLGVTLRCLQDAAGHYQRQAASGRRCRSPVAAVCPDLFPCSWTAACSCYPIWMDFSECMSKTEDPKSCKVGADVQATLEKPAVALPSQLLWRHRLLHAHDRFCLMPSDENYRASIRLAAGLPGRLPGVPAPPQRGAHGAGGSNARLAG